MADERENRVATITAVVATSIAHTGEVDFTYLWHATPATYGNPWGILELVDGAGSVDPFRGMQEGDWSSPEFRWNLSLSSGLHRGADFIDDGSSLRTMLQEVFEHNSDFSVLTTTTVQPYLQTACQELGVELVVHEVNAALATSGNPKPSGS